MGDDKLDSFFYCHFYKLLAISQSMLSFANFAGEIGLSTNRRHTVRNNEFFGEIFSMTEGELFLQLDE